MTPEEKRRAASHQLRAAWLEMTLAAEMLRDLKSPLATQHAEELEGAAKMVDEWVTEVLKP